MVTTDAAACRQRWRRSASIDRLEAGTAGTGAQLACCTGSDTHVWQNCEGSQATTSNARQPRPLVGEIPKAACRPLFMHVCSFAPERDTHTCLTGGIIDKLCRPIRPVVMTVPFHFRFGAVHRLATRYAALGLPARDQYVAMPCGNQAVPFNTT
jgi:hypothetical protein